MKHKDWENRLNASIKKHLDIEHNYELTNCLLLVFDAYEAQTGKKFFKDLKPYKTEKEGYKLFAKKGFKTVGQIFESKLDSVNRYSANRGDIATFFYNDVETCGIVTATGVIARSVYEDGTFGITHLTLDKVDRVFKVE